MSKLRAVLTTLEYSMHTRKKRQLTGGVLLSIALLFGGLGITVLLLQEDEDNDERKLE